MAAAIDSGFIAASLALPEATITSLQTQPTIDLVQKLLQHVQQKAQEFEEGEAAKLQLEVELETLSRETEGINKLAKETSEKHLKDLEEVRKKLAQEESARASVETELLSLKTDAANHKVEVEAARARIADLEASKREALALTDSRNNNHAKLSEELGSQQQKVNALRRELADLDEKRQTAENLATSAKFREQNLEQELEALKKNNTFLDEELSKRGADHSKFRKEKNARIAELQRSYEDAASEVDGLRRTESTLRSRVDELTRKTEDSLAKINTLQEEAIKTEEAQRTELQNTRLLGELHQQSADAAKAHAQEIQNNLSQLKDDAADEIGRLQAEIDAERQERETTEGRIADLEMQLDRLKSEGPARRPAGSVPATPRRGLNGSVAQQTPSRAGSPGLFGSPNLHNTNIADQQQVKTLIQYEQRRSQRLQSTIEEMIREMESRKPEMDELRTQYEHAAVEVDRLTQELEVAQRYGEKTRKDARKWHGEVAGVTREADLLRQQVRDLGLQLKVMLVEQQAEQQGLNDLSITQRNQYEQVIRGELDESALQGMSESGRFISQRLTIFRNIAELQEQNAQLLSATRQLTEDMEGEEAQAKKSQHEADKQELGQLREQVACHQHEIKTLESRSESYVRERDMFRQMLSRRGHGPESIAGQSNGMSPARSRLNSMEPDQVSEQAKLIRELQTSFDAYRQETSTDRTALKQQADRLGKEKSELQSSIAQIRSQLTLAQERHDLLNSNYNMLKSEHTELQKRAQSLSDAAIKQDSRTQQAAEELMESKGFVDGLRIEIASLKAEREIWKKMELRMEEDHRAAIEERSRLNKSMSDLQRLQSERELRDSEARRELQDRASSANTELQSLKRQLDTERETSRQTLQRRDYDAEQNRVRVDDLLKGISNVKEDLVKAQTERDQAKTRVEELKLDLTNAENRATILQPRQSSRPAVVNDENAPLTNNENVDNGADVEALQADLQDAERLLELARESEERYKAVATAAEEGVARLNEIYGQYQQETEALVTEKDAKIADLEKRTEEATTELSKVTADYAQLRNSQDEITRDFETQKQQLDADLARLRDDNERLTETTQLHREDLKAQAEIAQQAQQSYEDELIKHSEAAKALQKVRQDYNEVKGHVNESRAEAQSARENLEKNIESWAEQRKLLEKDITELRIRRADVNEQNQLLHKQLDEFSKQLEELKKAREGEATNGTSASSTHTDHYQEIVKHLQREKQIVDMQYDMASRDAKRLQHQLETTQQQLDETREKLSREMRAQIESERIQMDRDKLMQSINDLNVFKESNALLRIEAQQAREKIDTLEKQVEELRVQLEPLRERNATLDNELEMKNGEYKLLQENRDFWEKRTQDIMSKHNRADPAEVESLKTELSEAKTEREKLQSQVQPLQEQIDGFEAKTEGLISAAVQEQAKVFEERRGKIIDQARTKARKDNDVIKEKQAQIESSATEATRLNTEIDSLKSQIETIKKERDTAVTNAAPAALTAVAKPQETTTTANAEEGEVEEITADGTANTGNVELQERLALTEENLRKEAARATQAENEVKTLQARVITLESQIAELQRELVEAQAARTAASTQPATTDDSSVTQDNPTTAEGNAEVERLKSELAITRQEIESLRAAVVASAAVDDNTNTTQAVIAAAQDGASAVTEEQIQARIETARAEMQAQHDELIKKTEEQVNVRVKQRGDALKDQLNQKLRDFRAKSQDEAAKTVEAKQAEVEQLKSQLQELQAKQQPTPAVPASTNSATTEVKTEPAAAAFDFNNIGPDQVKQLLQNASIKGIMSRNINKRIEEEKEKLSEEQEAAVKKAVDQANVLQEKRGALKLNMANAKANNAQAKIEVVEQAAANTPQRPVVEVWELAKVAKPIAVAKPAPAPTAAANTPAVQASATQPTPAATPTNAAAVSTPAPAPSAPQAPAGRGQPPVNPFAAVANSQAATPQGQAQPQQPATSLPPKPSGIAPPGGRPAPQQPQQQSSGLPVPGGSGIPVPGGGRGRGQANRGGGSGIPQRGGGQQRGRGGQVQRGGRGGGSGSPMNAGARTFTPGQQGGAAKRPADGSPGGETAEKRPRGGGNAGF